MLGIFGKYAFPHSVSVIFFLHILLICLVLEKGHIMEENLQHNLSLSLSLLTKSTDLFEKGISCCAIVNIIKIINPSNLIREDPSYQQQHQCIINIINIFNIIKIIKIINIFNIIKNHLQFEGNLPLCWRYPTSPRRTGASTPAGIDHGDDDDSDDDGNDDYVQPYQGGHLQELISLFHL